MFGLRPSAETVSVASHLTGRRPGSTPWMMRPQRVMARVTADPAPAWISVADIHDWIGQLGDADASQRAAAAELLCRAGTAAAMAAVPLVRACADDNDQVREWAAAALEDLGPPPDDCIPQLVELVSGSHPLAAYWAVTLLGRSGQKAGVATAVLAACLDSDCDPSVAQRAAWALGKIGPAAAAGRAALEKAAAAADPRLARLAREALDAVGS